jgi:hypothetical protein
MAAEALDRTRSVTQNPGSTDRATEGIPADQDIDFVTMGMFIIGNRAIFFFRFVRGKCHSTSSHLRFTHYPARPLIIVYHVLK